MSDRSGRCSSRAASNRAERPVSRLAYQRRSAEEQALRRANIADILNKVHQPKADKSYPLEPVSVCDSLSFGAPPDVPLSISWQGSDGLEVDQGPLFFWSSFESGNLLSARLVNPEVIGSDDDPPIGLEYELHLDCDTQSGVGHTQWFYFGVYSQGFSGMVHFRIVNMRKKKSLHQHGMQPHVYSKVHQDLGWQPFACEDVSYTLNSSCPHARASTGNIILEHSTLAFSYKIETPGDEVYFAQYPPYTYTMLNTFLSQLEGTDEARNHFGCFELCRSIGQFPIPLVVITDNFRDKEITAKPALSVIARQHPGEIVGSFAVQGLIRFLLGPTPAAQNLRKSYVIHIVPMANVDGVVYGNSRCNLAGCDLNRSWMDPNPIIHPEVCAIKKHLSCLAQGVSTVSGFCKSLNLFIDFHGHSAEFGCFFYGSCPTSPIAAALFPKLCAVTSRDVCFERCHWRCPKSHRGSARYIIYKHCGVKHAFTMECSFFAPVQRLYVGGSTCTIFTPNRVEWIGCSVGCAAAALFATDGHRDHGAGREPEQPNPCIGQNCTCSDQDFLPNLSCPKVLALLPWLSIQSLESTTPKEILEGLTAVHGSRVPDISRGLQNDSGQDVGGSDGDEGVDTGGGNSCIREKSSKENSSKENGFHDTSRKEVSSSSRIQRKLISEDAHTGNYGMVGLDATPLKRINSVKKNSETNVDGPNNGQSGNRDDTSVQCAWLSAGASVDTERMGVYYRPSPRRGGAASWGDDEGEAPSPGLRSRPGHRPPPPLPSPPGIHSRHVQVASGIAATRCVRTLAASLRSVPAQSLPPFSTRRMPSADDAVANVELNAVYVRRHGVATAGSIRRPAKLHARTLSFDCSPMSVRDKHDEGIVVPKQRRRSGQAPLAKPVQPMSARGRDAQVSQIQSRGEINVRGYGAQGWLANTVGPSYSLESRRQVQQEFVDVQSATSSSNLVATTFRAASVEFRSPSTDDLS